MSRRALQFWKRANWLTVAISLGFVLFDLMPAIDPNIGHTRWTANPVYNIFPVVLAIWSSFNVFECELRLRQMDEELKKKRE